MAWQGHKAPLADINLLEYMTGQFRRNKERQLKQGGYTPSPASAPSKSQGGFLEGSGMFGIPKEALFMGGAGLLAGNRHNGGQLALRGFAGGMQNARQRQQQAEQRAKMDKFKKGLTPEQAMLFDVAPQAVAQGMAGRMFAEPTGPSYADRLAREKFEYQQAQDAKGAERPWWATPEGIDPAMIAYQQAGAPSTSVVVGADGKGYSSISEVPMGMPVPEDLLGGITLPEDIYAERVEGGPGFEFRPIPGSAAESKVQAREDSSTIDTLINDYSTLFRNKAIRSRNNSAVDNLAANYSSSMLGRAQDRIGGEVGNIDNDEARSNIEGLSMNALMKMISMSDVSAKAMDSDAEMKAWLTAIKSDNYESALVKLHVLDQSFGGGDALQRAFENKIIDQETYQWITRRVATDPYIQKMAGKAQRYAALGGEIGADNFTPSEMDSVGDLLEFMTPEERALFEGGG